MVSVWVLDGLEIAGWFGDGLGVVAGWLGIVRGWFGAGLGEWWGGQCGGEIRATIRAGLLSHWPDFWGPLVFGRPWRTDPSAAEHERPPESRSLTAPPTRRAPQEAP